MSRRPGLLLLALAMAASPALAHRLQVFAFADGGRIEGSAYFAGGGGAAAVSRIRILDTQGRLLAELAPDSQGAFGYQARAAEDHLVVAETGDGHRAEWRVSAAELGPGFPGGAPQAADGLAGPPSQHLPAGAELAVLVEQAVARQVRPLREELALAQGRAMLRDVLGGIGYILGLAGLLVWWRSRRASGFP